VRIVLVVPGGVDPPGTDRVIPFIHHLVEWLSARHDLSVIAIGHDQRPGRWQLFGADVVNVPVGSHSRTDVARVLASVPRLARRGGRPDIVHGLWANLTGLAAVVTAGVWRTPSVVSVCGGELARLPEINYGGAGRRGGRMIAGRAIRGATAVTVATEWMHDHVVTAGGRVDEVIPLGADLRRFSPNDESGNLVRPVPGALVHVGSLNAVKDQELLLRAAAMVMANDASVTLTSVGIDTMHGHHAGLAVELGIADRVRFVGLVDHAHLAPLVRGAALHVVTSHHEAGPVAVLEAAACGVPTVGTSVGHVADLARRDPPAAIAIADRSPAALAAAISKVLADQEGRERLARQALLWATAHDAVHTAQSFEMLYRRLIDRA
jgi:glycosyltransferase involved in cell wall biosynthesis